MANKSLTARVRLNTTDAEAKLKRVARAIDTLNRAVGKQSNAHRAVNTALQQNTTTTTRVKRETDKWANSTNQVKRNLAGTNSTLGSIGSKLKTIAATYLTMQGAESVIRTSDVITSAENRLNATNGNDTKLTAESMDKVYAAAQRSRSAYTDMLSNVSKTMALAGDSFQGNIDNAIRFQEIMAKAYTVGGASATEASTSMYQLVQALGSGTLAGDELRSVREGAPLAYKAIEKFAQKAFDTQTSLKDLAAEGVITSDIVVAAIMDMENGTDNINDKFKDTSTTFAQAWTKIKNTATKAFEPVLQRLNDALNSDTGKKAMETISKALIGLANVAMLTIDIFGAFFIWFGNNWNWIKYVVVAALAVITAYIITQTITAITNFIIQYWWLLVLVGAIALLIYAYDMWRQGAITTTEFIVYCLLAIAAVCFIVFGWQVALVILIIAIVIWAFEYVCWLFGFLAAVIVDVLSLIWNIIWVSIRAILAATMWLLAVIVDSIIISINIIIGIINLLCGLFLWSLALCYNTLIGVINAILQAVWACADPIIGIVEWILNVCNGGFESFGGAVANLIGQIISWFLTLGQVVTKIIDAIFGTDWTSGLKSLQDKVLAWGKNEDAITISRDAPEFDRIDAGDAFSTGFNAINYLELINPNDAAAETWNMTEGLHTGYVDPFAWGDTAKDWGSDVTDAVNEWGSQFQGQDSLFNDLFNLDNIANTLPKNGLGDAYDPSGANDDIAEGLKKLGNIEDDTGAMRDSMDLRDDDLEFLRKIADMEWRKEFTTAEIKIDMTNNNTVNGERDLDGLVDYLAETLREEMVVLADGVHY